MIDILLAILVIGAAYVLGRVHEAKYIEQKIRKAREVDMSSILDQATDWTSVGSVGDLSLSGQRRDRPASFARKKKPPRVEKAQLYRQVESTPGDVCGQGRIGWES